LQHVKAAAAIQRPRPMGLPAALNKRPRRTGHRAPKARPRVASDGVTAGFRLN
jgi:hypothetical protein